ncbi:hypothetical protein CK203_007678 [Vitis vinifera]|uniref:Uncharacterized protein n=1 Tax=Vitis vinifera TaxID=29760 RepID=A0A438ERM0_VITVI|nr:hypothetical protein CK203_111364 [Vitis vinifera]RVX15282.1 hypothetical protein CK203_007678 [Vitis vinifera]
MEESKKSCKSWGTTAKETSFKDEFNLESGIFVPTNQETNEEARIRKQRLRCHLLEIVDSIKLKTCWMWNKQKPEEVRNYKVVVSRQQGPVYKAGVTVKDVAAYN